MQNKNKQGFTLIEVLLGVTIFSLVITSGFFALVSAQLGTVKLIEETDITKEAFYFSEKFFDEIKRGGTLDYEEYFNRMVVGTGTTAGHFNTPTGFGNFGKDGITGTTDYGEGIYYCRSLSGSLIGTDGCYQPLLLNDFSSTGSGEDFGALLEDPQRFGQYAFQFIDYNSNANDESNRCLANYGGPGDENCSGSIRGDDDDEHLGDGPIVFEEGQNVVEIYLISRDKRERTLFRWHIMEDPFKSSSVSCNPLTDMEGCLGTIEFLKLDGIDTGNTNHNDDDFNGLVNTWLINEDFISGSNVIAGTGSTHFNSSRDFGEDNYIGDGIWQPLFPDTINVKNFEVLAYPNIDRRHAWKDNSPSTNINPYLKIKLTLTPSWKKRGQMRGEIPEIDLNTTINLADYFSR